MMSPPVDIIVPIYGGLEELRCCLHSVMANPQRTPTQLVLINDASPFPEIGEFLDAFVLQYPTVERLDNPENLGFVGTVNRGMRLHPERDLILLNSDTEVSGDWLDRLVACSWRAPEVATVTPFSNNATICSFPGYCSDNPLPKGFSLEEVDQAFATANAGLSEEIPTGVGFCMLIRRRALERLGAFDEARFGQGYGEENDFCRRAVAAGMVNLLCCDTFVRHFGGASFADEKDQRSARAQEILDRLYPDYHRVVHQHITADPQEVYRLAAWLQLLRASPRPKILHLTHHLGGGTIQHVMELMAYREEEADFLLLKPLEDGRVELDLSGNRRSMLLEFDLPQQFEALLQLLHSVGLSRIHFHHTLGLETSLWGLPHRLGIPFDLTLHDYYFINANPTQTDEQGRYTDQLEQQAKPYPLPVTLAEWQENQKGLLYGAERVIAPSEHTIGLYRKHFPDAHYIAAYHPEWEQSAPYPGVTCTGLASGEVLRVLVFGAISIEKGADLLEAAACKAKEEGAPLEFHLIGYAYRPLEGVVEHGSYTQEGVVEQIKALQPHLIWFTALWPETYSYTLSEALKSGLPVVAPNHGAFPERLEGRPLTWVEPWDQPLAAWLDLFARIRDPLIEQKAATPLAWSSQPTPDGAGRYYRDEYLVRSSLAAPAQPLPNHAWLSSQLDHSREGRQRQRVASRRERMLVRLVHLRNGRLGRWLSRLVPVALQRLIKRKLSRRPIHELL